MLSFDRLVTAIGQTHADLAAQALRAVNASLTLRNWMIGFHIEEYERRGVDRQQYGEKLLDRLSEALMKKGVSRCERRELYRYRQFYLTYPKIVETLSPQSGGGAQTALNLLSFSHFVELIAITDDAKRAFYETECLRGNWSVRDPYVFEFLGLKPQEVMAESQLEDQLLDKLHDFLLELGHGFCFEARQKRILSGDNHYFVDLVFYHRILKCHVLAELKVAAFSHENIGQLNTYVSWYRKNMRTEGDNPPVGILLCTQKDHALVEYALAGIDNGLFVSKYLLELPKKEEIQRIIEKHLATHGGERHVTSA